jgi:hypothetical protein
MERRLRVETSEEHVLIAGREVIEFRIVPTQGWRSLRVMVMETMEAVVNGEVEVEANLRISSGGKPIISMDSSCLRCNPCNKVEDNRFSLQFPRERHSLHYNLVCMMWEAVPMMRLMEVRIYLHVEFLVNFRIALETCWFLVMFICMLSFLLTPELH